MSLSQDELIRFIEENELSNSIICIHSSFRSLGGFDGDISDFCDIFLDRGCTLMVPSHSWHYININPTGWTPTKQSRWDYKKINSTGFNPDSNIVDPDKGILTNYILSLPERVRTNNPLGSFTAVGPRAKELMKNTDSYSTHFERFTELNGTILLLGISCAKMSYIHYVREVCEIGLHYLWVKDENDRQKWVAGGGCSKNFSILSPILAPISDFKQLGDAEVQLYKAQDVFNTLKPYFETHGNTTRCEDFCQSCSESENVVIIDEDECYQIKANDTPWELGEKFNVPSEHILSLSAKITPSLWAFGFP